MLQGRDITGSDSSDALGQIEDMGRTVGENHQSLGTTGR